MSQEFKWKLQTGSKKSNCPACGKKTFKHYVFTATNEPVGEAFGRCDRENNCGYHQIPEREIPEPVATRPQLPPPSVIIPSQDYLQVLEANTQSNFHSFCINQLGISPEHLQAWRIGAKWKFTAFLLINREGLPVNAKFVAYTAEGKRDKSEKADGEPTFIPHYLGKAYLRSQKIETDNAKLEDWQDYYKFARCFFGEHLFDIRKNTCLVESEKSAVLASYFFPDYNWLATGGNNGMMWEQFEIFSGYTGRIWNLVDNDLAGITKSKTVHWLDKLAELRENKEEILSVNLFEKSPSGWDIADAIIYDTYRDPAVFAKALDNAIDCRMKIEVNEDTGEVALVPKKKTAPLPAAMRKGKAAPLPEDPEEEHSEDQPGWDKLKARQWRKIFEACQKVLADEFVFITKENAMAWAHDFAFFGIAGKAMYLKIGALCEELDEDGLTKKINKALTLGKSKNGKKLLIKLGEAGYRADRDGDETIYMAVPYRGFKFEITEDIDDVMEKDLKEWGFITYKNSYWFSDGFGDVIYLNQRTNFILKVLYHIETDKAQSRVIDFINEHGRTKSKDISTDELSELGRFKKVTEGLGNFMFYGKPEDFMRIKGKLYEEEKSAEQLETLGWHDDGFFAFCNGVYNSEFIPVDEHGMLTYKDKNYFIPFHPKTNRYSFLNEKKFFYRHSTVTFEEWCLHYTGAFGNVGQVMLVFGLATVFSDIIFKHKNNFPLIFLYGEGGSGKSTMIQYVQMLFGVPQAPIKLTEKANTDKAKIRKLAQFVNALICFEEYTDTIDISVDKTLSGFYDRFGYERSDIKSKYGTESVPVESAVCVTGNFYPTDDPFLQRLILMDYNVNIREDKVIEHFDKLNLLNMEGITNITGQLIGFRDDVDREFPLNYRRIYGEFNNAIKSKGIKVPSRMAENYSVLLTMFHILKDKLKFTFSYAELMVFLQETIAIHAEKRDTGGVVQNFWDMVLYMTNPKVNLAKHGLEYSIEGDEIYIRFKQLWTLYNKAHFEVHRRAGVPYNTLLGKLKDKSVCPAYIETKDNKRFAGHYENNSSALVFRYSQIGVKLPSGYEEQQPTAQPVNPANAMPTRVTDNMLVDTDNPYQA
jgi:hypothetical protein